MKTPICDEHAFQSEPHGYEVVPLSVAREFETQLAEAQQLLSEKTAVLTFGDIKDAHNA